MRHEKRKFVRRPVPLQSVENDLAFGSRDNRVLALSHSAEGSDRSSSGLDVDINKLLHTLDVGSLSSEQIYQ